MLGLYRPPSKRKGRGDRKGREVVAPGMMGVGGNAMVQPVYRPVMMPMYGAVMVSPGAGMMMAGPGGISEGGAMEHYGRGYADALSDSKAAERLARYGGGDKQHNRAHDMPAARKNDHRKPRDDLLVRHARGRQYRKIVEADLTDDDVSVGSHGSFERAVHRNPERGHGRPFRMHASANAHADVDFRGRREEMRARPRPRSPRMPNIDEFVEYGGGEPDLGRFSRDRGSRGAPPYARRMPMSPEMMEPERFGRAQRMEDHRRGGMVQEGPRRASGIRGREVGGWY